MTDALSAPQPASLPSIRQYLLSLIVGDVNLSFALVFAASYFRVVRAAQESFVRAEMGRAHHCPQSQES